MTLLFPYAILISIFIPTLALLGGHIYTHLVCATDITTSNRDIAFGNTYVNQQFNYTILEAPLGIKSALKLFVFISRSVCIYWMFFCFFLSEGLFVCFLFWRLSWQTFNRIFFTTYSKGSYFVRYDKQYRHGDKENYSQRIIEYFSQMNWNLSKNPILISCSPLNSKRDKRPMAYAYLSELALEWNI